LIFFFAGYLTDHKDDLKSFAKGFMVPMILLVLPVGLLFGFQNHLSVGIIITLVSVLMFCIAGVRMTYILALGGVGIIGGTIYIMNSIANNSTSFRFRRYLTFLNPWADPTGDGYQIIHSLYAIGSGGFLGAGLGKSTQKYAYIPEPENDFIFAVLAEELGFVGCVALIALFGFFIWRGIKISRNCEDMFGALLAIGITSFVGIQAILNIAVVTSIMPTTGISLPFFSYGGTALLILLFSMGVLLNISRHKKVEEEKED
jgi:cell division protein FtsW